MRYLIILMLCGMAVAQRPKAPTDPLGQLEATVADWKAEQQNAYLQYSEQLDYFTKMNSSGDLEQTKAAWKKAKADLKAKYWTPQMQANLAKLTKHKVSADMELHEVEAAIRRLRK